MKTIGLIGGMSWESSAHYYRIINQSVRVRLGGVSSARLLLLSVDFGAVEPLQRAGDKAALARLMVEAAASLERGGADLLLICTNTMHEVAEAVVAAASVPLLHIVDPTARAIRAAGLRTIGLLGTAYTMEQAFYRDRLTRHGLDVIVPEPVDRGTVHRIIYDELVTGQVLSPSREACRAIIARLAARGAQAIVLGCTELMLLIRTEDAAVPLFDTTELHALAAVDEALGAEPSRATP